MAKPFGAALLLALLAAPAPEVALEARAEAGDALVRTFETTWDMELAELRLVVEGEEHEVPEVPSLRSEGTERIVVSDEVLAAEDGRPTRLSRTYDEAFQHEEVESDEGGEVRERETGLEGATVVFSRGEEDGEWRAEAGEDGAVDPELLEGLRADLSLAELLPAGEVEEGASWEVDPAHYALFFQPAGELHLEDAEEEDGLDRVRISADLLESVEGTITATYRGTREEDGREVGVIALEIDVELRADVDDEEGLVLELARDVEGELLWDLEAGRLHAVSLAGDASESLRSTRTVDSPQGELELERVMTFAGEATYRFRLEPR